MLFDLSSLWEIDLGSLEMGDIRCGGRYGSHHQGPRTSDY